MPDKKISVLADLRENVSAGSGSAHLGLGSVVRTVLTARYGSALLFRLSHKVGSFISPLGGLIKQLNQLLTGADIAWQAEIGEGLVLFHPVGVVIGEKVQIGAKCVIQQGVTLGGLGGPRGTDLVSPQLGDRVFLGAGARVIGDITIHDDCVVGANAVVTKSSPGANHVAMGLPARWRERTHTS